MSDVVFVHEMHALFPDERLFEIRLWFENVQLKNPPRMFGQKMRRIPRLFGIEGRNVDAA